MKYNLESSLKVVGLLFTLAFDLANTQAFSAESSYYRFWRGDIKAGLTATDFKNALNETLLPATGALKGGASELRSYQPVLVLNPNSNSPVNLPSEVALVEYQSEAAYKAFRATDVGQAYGNLHWEMFEQSRSKSLVPESYPGTVEINKAYDVLGGHPDWNSGLGYFRVYLRSVESSDEQYLLSVQKHIEERLSFAPRALVILVDSNYVMEYSLFDSTQTAVLGSSELPLALDFALKQGRSLEFGSGVQFGL